MLPAYVPNSAAALFGGGKPIDAGRKWHDGRRIFGDGKTIRGFFGGVACGCLVGLCEIIIQKSGFLVYLPEHSILSVFLLAVGALLGDLIKSFFKRRRGIDRGNKWPVIDQYDFLIGSLVLLTIGDPVFVLQNLTIPILVVILIVTPLLHRIVNIIGYYIGVKKVPW